jgi:hypothetical protein
MATLPTSFCDPVRNPYEKRNSQYKIYEWMAVLHWYFVPMAIELRLPTQMTQNFSKLVRIVEFAMTPIPRSDTDLAGLEVLIKDFLEEFEKVYDQDSPITPPSMERFCPCRMVSNSGEAYWRTGAKNNVTKIAVCQSRKQHLRDRVDQDSLFIPPPSGDARVRIRRRLLHRIKISNFLPRSPTYNQDETRSFE